MSFPIDERGDEYDIDETMPIVVGMQPYAELWHRPLAYRVRDRIEDWQETYCDERVIVPVVLSDVWVLNHRAYETRPAISVGGPRHNALTAFLTEHLPVVAAEDERFLLQMDHESVVARCCLWGGDPTQTQRAVDLFLSDYIDDWMQQLMSERQPESSPYGRS